MKKTWPIAATVLLATLLNACVHAPQPYVSDLPYEMRFYLTMTSAGRSGWSGADVTYQITRDGYILSMTREDVEHGRPIRCYRITTAGWRKFQTAVRPLELTKWKPSYDFEMTDGWRWEMAMIVREEKPVTDGTVPVYNHVISSEGENAGPIYGNPKKTSSGLAGPRSGEMFLVDALGELWHDSKKP